MFEKKEKHDKLWFISFLMNSKVVPQWCCVLNFKQPCFEISHLQPHFQTKRSVYEIKFKPFKKARKTEEK